jgi:hypothetical protein
MWVYVPKAAKLSKFEKENLNKLINENIKNEFELKEMAKNIEIKSGRVYFYKWIEQKGDYGILLKPLKEGKYLEIPFARITLYDSSGRNCSAEYNQYNGKWFTLKEGSIADCIKFISDNLQYFY